MPQSDRSSVGIHALRIEPRFLDHRQRLRRKGFIQLDHVNVGKLQSGQLQALGIANTGPSPISSGLYPAVAKDT